MTVEVQVEYQEKVLHQLGGRAPEQASQGTGHDTKFPRVQEASTQCSKSYDLIFE